MQYYKHITIFECLKRIEKLNKFKELVVSYFNDLDYDLSGDPIADNNQMVIRSKINLVINDINYVILNSGVNPNIQYTPPAMIGGYIQNINLVKNIFVLQTYRIAPVFLLDKVEESIGIYKSEQKAALIRTFNPFFWIFQLIRWLISLPIILFKNAGFNTEKFESSNVGKLYKLLSEIFLIFATFLTVLQILGFQDLIEMISLFFSSIF